jgi:cytochrome P450
MFLNHLFQSEQMTSCVKGPTVHTKHLAMFLGKNSIIHKDGTEWKTHRKNMTKTFNSDTIDNIDGPVRKETSKFVEALLEEVDSTKDGEYRMNGEVLSAALVSNVVGKVFFGLKLQGSVLERDELSSVYDSLLGEFDRRARSPFNPAARFYGIPTPANIKYKKDHRRARQMFVDTLKKHNKRDSAPKAWKGRSDFLMAILDVVEEQGNSSDDEEVIDMMVTAYLLSLESMMTTVQYMLYCSAKNPEVEEKCLEEINSVLEKSGELDVDQLPYCNAFIMEVLRLYPILPFSWRKLESPLTIGKTTLPAGMKV